VKSVTTEKFRLLYAAASRQRREQIRKAYKIWLENPDYPSLRFKKVSSKMPIYSARVDLDWRALGILKDDTIIWFWVGSHDEYDALLKKM